MKRIIRVPGNWILDIIRFLGFPRIDSSITAYFVVSFSESEVEGSVVCSWPSKVGWGVGHCNNIIIRLLISIPLLRPYLSDYSSFPLPATRYILPPVSLHDAYPILPWSPFRAPSHPKQIVFVPTSISLWNYQTPGFISLMQKRTRFPIFSVLRPLM